MEGIVIVILLALIFFIFIMPIMAMASAKSAERSAKQAHDRIRELEVILRDLKRKPAESEPVERVPLPRARTVIPEPRSTRPPPPLPTWDEEELIRLAAKEIPIDPPSKPSAPVIDEPSAPARPAFSIEQFLGVKLFAWLGGVALFFGVIFFVKYAFEHNLISPATRIVLGFVTGLALLGGGLWTNRREKYRVLAHALCATGVLVLYGVSFAAHAVYQFPAFNQGFTFMLMAVVTVAAFLTAVRLNALVVAVLGMLGGFLSPLLLPLVQDHPLALFGYIALLDIGLLALAKRGRWTFLATGAVAGTIGMLIHWTARFFEKGEYFLGGATLVPMGLLLGFCALFLIAAVKMPHSKSASWHIPASGLVMLLAAMAFAFFFLSYRGITDRIFLLYGYVLLINLAGIVLGVMHPHTGKGVMVLGGLTFIHLVLWTEDHLTRDMLGSALAVYLVFGALHTLWPAILEKMRVNGGGAQTALSNIVAPWLPAAVIALMAFALCELPEVSMLIWPAILVANLLTLAACVRRGVVLPVLVSLGLTMLTAAIWLFQMPREIPSLHSLIGVVMAFSMFFTGSGLWLARLFVVRGVEGARSPEKLLPLASAAMPFLLLIMMTLRVPVPDPTPVFGAAMALAALMLAVAMLGKLPLLHIGAFACCLLIQWVWHESWFSKDHPYVALVWYLLFYLVFTLVPFVFRSRCSAHAAPWIASALSGVGCFLLVHDLVKRAFPNEWMGLVPAAFAVPALVALGIEWRRMREMDDLTKSRLAWFGAVALLFLTLIFPIQYERQWLTIGWALEGAALLWLFRRVPHQGLVVTGVGLLCVAFSRLALNPAVLLDYERGSVPIFNWYLYTYGIVSAALIAGALLTPRTHPMIDVRIIRALLFSLGGILLFLLLNIQIADAFTEPGEKYLAIEFSGNFARDMTYTIGWAVFALILLVIGIVLKAKEARYAAIALLVVALIKLFLHDLANIENIFRIAALLCVGVIAFIASFLYQRFVPAVHGERSEEMKE
jgi:uncharacterized membrane protein